jgi:hypothetical protein
MYAAITFELLLTTASHEGSILNQKKYSYEKIKNNFCSRSIAAGYKRIRRIRPRKSIPICKSRI